MKERECRVPSGIKYISEWLNYELPKGEHCIVDKGVTGCGYTEFCLTNKENVILCSPRKLLLENKRDQHTKDPNILYLENDISDFSGVKSMEDRIRDHIFFCTFKHLPVKIMVTYDSLHYVAEYLFDTRELNNFIFVVDEFQSIFLDSYFKSEVEMDFVESLQICPNVIYLSATPMLDKYLELLPQFKDLTIYHLIWDDTGYVEKVTITRRRVASLGSECGKIIDDYVAGRFPVTLGLDGKPKESKEMVSYFNSLADILRIVSKKGLTPNNTLILCSPTPENEKKLLKYGFKIGRVPLKGEENPMFMFCTSAIYMGVDLYSDNASTFVFADPNIESLALDISLDLPQIVGRQRNRENPFKNRVTLFFKTRRGDKEMTAELFKENQEARRKETWNLLRVFERSTEEEKKSIINKLKDSIIVSRYSRDFISISKNTNLPVYNYLIEIANERAWDVSRNDYQDDITVTKAIQDTGMVEEKYYSRNEILVTDFLTNRFFKTGIFAEKMKMYCEFRDLHKENREIINSLSFKLNSDENSKFRLYYEFYGTSGCRAVGYQEADLKRGWRDSAREDKLRVEIGLNFKLGDRFTLKEAKGKLTEIYKSLGISKTAKAKDLENYYTISRTKITTPDKKVIDGYKITGIK